MDNQEYNKEIGGKFGHEVPPMSSDELWNEIEPKLKKKKKRRVFVILFFMGVAGLLSLFNKSDRFDLKKSDLDSEQVSEAALTKDPVNSNEAKIEGDATFDALKHGEEIIFNEPKNLANDGQGSTQAQEALHQSNSKNGSSNSSSVVKKEVVKKIEKALESEPISKMNQVVEEAAVSQYESSGGVHIKDGPQEEDEEEGEEEKDRPQQTHDQSKDKSIDASNKSESSLANEKTAQEGAIADLEIRKAKPAKSKSKSNSDIMNVQWNMFKIDWRKFKINWRKFIDRKSWEPYASARFNYIYAPHQLIDSNSGYKKFRKSHVKPIQSFGLDVAFAFKQERGLILYTGFQGLNLSERIRQNETIVRTHVEELKLSETHDSQGNIIAEEYGEVVVKTTTVIDKRSYNDYRAINIPFGIGYGFESKKMKFDVIAGVDFNLFTQYSGSILNDSKSFEKVSDTSGKFYNPFIGERNMGFWTSLSLHRKINKQMAVSLSPKFRTPIKNSRGIPGPYEHKILQFGLGLGVQYKLTSGY